MRRSRRRQLRPSRLLLLLLPLALLVGACGIESDSSPRELADDQLPDELQETSSTTTPTDGSPTQPEEVWFLSNELLARTTRDVEVREGINGAINALLDGPTDQERAAGYTTSIPAGTELLRAQPAEEERLLTINLSDELATQQASELRNSVAQIVFTATSFNSAAIQRVRFQIDGEATSVPGAAGSLEPVVTRADYADLDPQQAEDP
jgi:spore germination protein GerM